MVTCPMNYNLRPMLMLVVISKDKLSSWEILPVAAVVVFNTAIYF